MSIAVARLGIITDEITEDFEHALAVCHELGIGSIELRSVWQTNIVDMADDALARLDSLIANANVTVCGIASPFLKCHAPGHDKATIGNTHSAGERGMDEQWDILLRSLELAERFDAPLVRTFSFWRLDDPLSIEDELVETLARATDQTRRAGRLLGLENEYACNIGSGQEAAHYLGRISDPTLGLIWDPGNEAALGLDPIPTGYEAARSRIHHVHLKDPEQIEVGTGFTVVGQGAIDYAEQFRLLTRDGYDGVLSLETHFALDGSKEAATRACIPPIRDLAARSSLSLD